MRPPAHADENPGRWEGGLTPAGIAANIVKLLLRKDDCLAAETRRAGIGVTSGVLLIPKPIRPFHP